jgi:hypothetical protein
MNECVTTTDWFRRNASAVLWWAALVVGSLMIFSVSRGTQFQQFGIALLVACLSLLAAIGIFEAIWQLLTRLFDHDDNEKGA